MLSHAQKQQISSLPSHVQCDLWKEDRLLQQRLEELRKETAYIVGSISRSQKVLHRKLKNLEHRMSTHSYTTQQQEENYDGNLVYRKRKSEVKRVTPKEYFSELLSSSNASRLLRDYDLKCELAPLQQGSTSSKKGSQSAQPYRKKVTAHKTTSAPPLSSQSSKYRSKSAITPLQSDNAKKKLL